MKFKFSRVLVTGGCGFIGSHYIELLSKKYPEVTILNLDLCTYAVSQKTIDLLDSLPNYSMMQGSICDHSFINKIYNDYQPDLVVNFAAESHVDNSINNPNIFIDTNVLGTVNLIKNLVSSKNSSLHKTLFHQISTDEVFGDTDLNSKELFVENSPLKPSSPYSASKASSDHMVRAWSRTFSLRYLITNCGNNFGPRQHFEKLIPTIILKILKNEKVPVYGTGQNIRDWIYVEDHAEMLLEIQNSNSVNETFLIGMMNEQSNLNIVKEIIKTLQPSSNIDGYIEFVKDRLGHDYRYALNNAKLENMLGKKFRSNFPEQIRSTVEWYLKNRNWFE